MKSLLILSILFTLSSQFSEAKELISKITDVVVFPNKVFVTRSLNIKVKKGTGTLDVFDLTPNADSSSIKIKVPDNMRGFEVLAVKSDMRTLTKSKNPELEKLMREKDKNNNQINQLTQKINTIHRSNTNLSELSSHYIDSFSANLHSAKFKKKDFSDLVGFVKTKNNVNLNFWLNNYKKLQSLYKENIYINNQISKLLTGADRNVLELKVDYSSESPKSGVILIQYLVNGAGWSPAYDLRLNSESKNALITQQAYIWQNTGENWKDVSISLSTEANPEKSDPPSIYPQNLSYREVEKVKTNIMNKNETQKVLVAAQSHDSLSNQSSSLVQRFKPKGKFTILNNHPKVRIPINSKSQRFSEETLAIAGKFNRAFRSTTLNNPFESRMNSGPLFIFRDGKFIQQTPLKSRGPGENFTVNTGFLTNIQISHNYQYDKEQPGILDKTKRIARKSITRLKNYKNKPVILKLYDQVPISQIDELKVKTEQSSEGLKKDQNKESWNYWIITLKPDEWKTYEMKVALEVPEAMNFQWPN